VIAEGTSAIQNGHWKWYMRIPVVYAPMPNNATLQNASWPSVPIAMLKPTVTRM
jgi:hypothetical protein